MHIRRLSLEVWPTTNTVRFESVRPSSQAGRFKPEGISGMMKVIW
jgi:hypothetical protein